MIPVGVPTPMLIPTESRPTQSEIRDPWMMRLNTSRPRLSVPNQLAPEGGCRSDFELIV